METKIKTGWARKTGIFLISQNVSLFGSSVIGYAVIWYITLKTSSGVWLMLATICSALPQVLLSPFGGVWADRYNRKMLIMLADAGIAFCTLLLAIAFFLGFERLELLLVVSAVRSLGAGIQTPAVNAVYPQIVPAEKLVKVQGINQTLNSVLLLLSPALGGVMLGTLGLKWTFLLDVVTAILAIVIISFIKIEKPKRSDAPVSVFGDLKKGIVYAFSNKLLRNTLICFGIAIFLITPAAVLSPLFIERVFGGEIWRLTANEIFWTGGSIIGGIIVALKSKFKNKVKVIAVCLCAFGVTFAVLGYTYYYWIFVSVMAVSGFFMPFVSTAQVTLLQENVREDMMGRVFSLVGILSASAMPIAILIFGPLADVMPMEILFAVSGALLILTGIIYGVRVKREPPVPLFVAEAQAQAAPAGELGADDSNEQTGELAE